MGETETPAIREKKQSLEGKLRILTSFIDSASFDLPELDENDLTSLRVYAKSLISTIKVLDGAIGGYKKRVDFGKRIRLTGEENEFLNKDSEYKKLEFLDYQLAHDTPILNSVGNTIELFEREDKLGDIDSLKVEVIPYLSAAKDHLIAAIHNCITTLDKSKYSIKSTKVSDIAERVKQIIDRDYSVGGVIPIELNIGYKGIALCDEKSVYLNIWNLFRNSKKAIEGRFPRSRPSTEDMRRQMEEGYIPPSNAQENGKLALNIYDEDNYVVFEIIDNGIGFDRAKISSNFEGEHQFKKGSGIGLRTSANSIHENGGYILVTTTFQDDGGQLHSYSFNSKTNKLKDLETQAQTGTSMKVYLPKAE